MSVFKPYGEELRVWTGQAAPAHLVDSYNRRRTFEHVSVSLAEEFGISLANTVVFTAGDRSKYVTSDQMAGPPASRTSLV